MHHFTASTTNQVATIHYLLLDDMPMLSRPRPTSKTWLTAPEGGFIESEMTVSNFNSSSRGASLNASLHCLVSLRVRRDDDILKNDLNLDSKLNMLNDFYSREFQFDLMVGASFLTRYISRCLSQKVPKSLDFFRFHNF